MPNTPPAPLAAILAEMRRDNRPYGISPDRLRSYADRIWAAAKRERAIADALLAIKDKPLPHPDPDNAPPLFVAPGNAAALRAALMAVRGDLTSALHPNTSRAIIDAALAAPARNCDTVHDEREALDRCRESVAVERDAAYDRGMRDAIHWLLATAEKGGEA